MKRRARVPTDRTKPWRRIFTAGTFVHDAGMFAWFPMTETLYRVTQAGPWLRVKNLDATIT